jgi:hypothetical protein
LNEEDARKLDKIVTLDRFVYLYAVAAKSRGDDDDTVFMGQLQESLISFKRKKAASEAAAATAFTFDTEPRPAPTDEKAEKKTKGQKAKVRQPN